MSNRIRALCLILLMTAFVLSLLFRHADSAPHRRDQTRQLRCTKEALAALKPIPNLDYECREREDDSLKSPERRAAMKSYLSELESSFADSDWWAAPVDDLNTCSVIHEVRAMSDEERRDFDSKIDLFGDQSTRLVVVVDPCIAYSYNTLNAFILQRDGERVYATQVLDAYFTRADAAVDMRVAEQNGERLILVETHTADGTMPPSPYTTCAVYDMDPRTHRAVPKKLFREGAKLTNKFRWDDYVFEDERMAKQWRAPEIVRDGKLSPRFYVYTRFKRRLVRSIYVWNGKYYVPR